MEHDAVEQVAERSAENHAECDAECAVRAGLWGAAPDHDRHAGHDAHHHEKHVAMNLEVVAQPKEGALIDARQVRAVEPLQRCAPVAGCGLGIGELRDQAKGARHDLDTPFAASVPQ